MRAVTLTLNITPDYPVPLGASSAKRGPFTIADPIEANILFLFPRKSEPVVLISVDLLYVGPDLESAVVNALPNIPRSNILLGATHTHFAPMTDLTKPLLGGVDRIYLQDLQERLTNDLQKAMLSAPRLSVTLRATTTQARHSINRRTFRRVFFGRRPHFNQIAMAPNPSGPKDETVTLVSVVDDRGNALAFIWNYACHPVSHPQDNVVSAHYPGVVRDALREAVGNQVPVLFFQGFSGNTRPNATTENKTLPDRLRRLVSGPVFGRFTHRNYLEWTGSLAEVVKTAVKDLSPVEVSNVRTRRMEVEGEKLTRPSKHPLSVQAIQLGESLKLVGVSGEVVVEYAKMVRALADAEHCLVIGCLDTPFGYIPTERMQREGGYESTGYLKSFGLTGLSLDIEKETISAIEQTVNSLESIK